MMVLDCSGGRDRSMGDTVNDDILGYRYLDEEVICSECIADEERVDTTEHETLTESDVDNADEYLYCDRCASKLLT